MMTEPAELMASIPQDRRVEDMRLSQAVARGDENARRLLAERLVDKIYRMLVYLAGNREDAEDMTQMALIQILRSAGSFRGECSLERWANRVAVQTMAKQLEKRTRRARLSEAKWQPPAETKGTEEEVELTRVRARLAQKIRKLDAKQRTAVVLHYLNDYSIADIADITGVPVNTVRGRLRDGRALLRKMILADPLLGDWIGWRKNEHPPK